MKKQTTDNHRNLSMQELFRMEAETQIGLLTNGLLELEKQKTEIGSEKADLKPLASEHLESLMRAAHSLKLSLIHI